MPARLTARHWTLMGLVAAGLVLDAIVHFDLASAFSVH